MFIVGLLSWWYGAGWRARAVMLREQLATTADYFSIDLLLRTLFQPFRQISAGSVRGPLGVQLRAFLDRLISRLIGAMVRTAIIVIGGVTIVIFAILGGLGVIAWLLVPTLPLLGCALWIVGWMPWNL